MKYRSIWRILARIAETAGVGFRGTRDAIVMYHSVGDAFGNPHGKFRTQRFARQLDRIRRTADIVPLPELLETPVTEHKRVAVTFDDGYEDFLTNALPVLQRADVPATLFVIPDRVGTEWHQSGYDRPARLLSWDQLATVADDPLIDIGNHTLTHPDLTTLDDEQLRREINGAHDRLRDRLGVDVTGFCYPGGSYDGRVADIVAQRHEYAVTVRFGLSPTEWDRFELPRIDGARSPAVVRWELSDYAHTVQSLYRTLSTAVTSAD